MAVTVRQYVRLEPRIEDDFRTATMDGLNAAAREIARQTNAAVKVSIGADQRLGHATGRDRARVEAVVNNKATSKTRPVATVAVRGPTALIERPRRGNYRVRAPKGQALRTPRGFRAEVQPGAITNPPRPIHRTFGKASRIAKAAVGDEVHSRLRARYGDR